MSEERKRTVKVMCSIPNGVELRVQGEGYDDGTGSGKTMQGPITDRIVLRGPNTTDAGVNSATVVAPVENEVDAELWARWKGQFKKQPHPFLADGHIVADDDEAKNGD